MEIKVGDKVRVREDAPIHIVGSASEIKCEAVVFGTDADIAVIGFRTREKQRYDAYKVPTKYLTKVEDEAKEPKPKYKAGDRMFIKYINKIGVIDIVEGYNEEEDGICYHLKVEPKGVASAREENLTPYAEPTEEKIKLGDMVRVKGNLHEPICLDADLHLEITNIPPHAVSRKKWKVVSVERRRDCAEHIYTLKHDNSFIYNIPQDCVELVQSKEQTEEKEPTDLTKEVANNLSNVLEGCCNAINKIANNFDCNTYTADLAHDIAVKIVNKNMENNPKEVGEYAVQVAKSVVEELKRK